MTHHLAILIHADPVVRERYEVALRSVGEPVTLLIVNSRHAGLSAAYKALAAELRATPGTLLEALARYAGALPLSQYSTVTISTFSAGYALARELLWEPESFAAIDAVVGIDSWHSAKDPDGTPSDFQLGGLVRCALRAKEGARVCWLGHSDVRTYGKVSSTTEVANEVLRLVGDPRPGAGGLHVRAHDVAQDPGVEHSRALTEWGPQWLAEAIRCLLDRRSYEDTAETAAAPPSSPLGVRALRLSRSEQAAGVKEIRGSTHHPRILEYFRGCVRGGRSIGAALQSDEYAWCAAAASWAAHAASEPGETLPHRWRAAVRELWADALELGTARSAALVRSGGYEPQAGDLAIFTRGGPVRPGADPFAATSGRGHVGRITEWREEAFDTLDGNVGDAWTDVRDRRLMAAEFVGVIDCTDEAALTPDDDGLEGLRQLDAARFLHGMGRPLWPHGMDVLEQWIRRHHAELQP